MPTPPRPVNNVLGRRRREPTLADLPDEVLLKIIHHVLESPTPGRVSQRAVARFRTRGRALALLSRRFHALVCASVTAVEAGPRAPAPWAFAMVVFARDSLTALHVATQAPWRVRAPARAPVRASLCMLLAEVRPPLRELALAGLGGAPFEHVVAMLRALPSLREIDLQTPRPMDVAAIARTCVGLERLSLGPVCHEREVDEMRRQFINLVCSPVAKTLSILNIPWSCATVEAFGKITTNCPVLERFGAELGAIHWIRHRAFKATAPMQVDLCACAREQGILFRTMLTAVAAQGSLRSFAVHTMDGIPMRDLEIVFRSLKGLRDLDLLIGSSTKPVRLGPRSFQLLKASLSPTLRRINIVGITFGAEQVLELASFPKLTSLTVWMGEDQKPDVEVFKRFGTRVKHLRILCDWTEEMCQAVGTYNTAVESLLLVATDLPMSALSSVVSGVGSSLKEFRLFINQPAATNGPHGPEGDALEAEAKLRATSFVNDASRIIAKGCSANLEVLNVSATSASNLWFTDCTPIAAELRKTSPHLWQICEVEAAE